MAISARLQFGYSDARIPTTPSNLRRANYLQKPDGVAGRRNIGLILLTRVSSAARAIRRIVFSLHELNSNTSSPVADRSRLMVCERLMEIGWVIR